MSILAQFKTRLPLLAAQQGVWDGLYRRIGPDGVKFAEHKSRVTIQYAEPDANTSLYTQTNVYTHADGKVERIITTGDFKTDRIVFANERSSGWAMDDPCDPEGRTCLMVITFHADAGVYKAGMRLYEMIQLSACGQFRNRVTQFIQDGKILMRTLIDEARALDGAAQ